MYEEEDDDNYDNVNARIAREDAAFRREERARDRRRTEARRAERSFVDELRRAFHDPETRDNIAADALRQLKDPYAINGERLRQLTFDNEGSIGFRGLDFDGGNKISLDEIRRRAWDRD